MSSLGSGAGDGDRGFGSGDGSLSSGGGVGASEGDALLVAPNLGGVAEGVTDGADPRTTTKLMSKASRVLLTDD